MPTVSSRFRKNSSAASSHSKPRKQAPPRLAASDRSNRPAYRRILLKLSGESLRAEGEEDVIDSKVTRALAGQIREIRQMGVQVAIVIGGGNIWRGLTAERLGMDRATADYMGMLATVINGLALQDALEKRGVNTRVQTAIEMKNVAEPFVRRRAIRHLEKGRVVIFVAGVGSPYFSTDTTAALRANEINAEVILKATKVDGIYDSDPRRNPNAKRYSEISYMDAIRQRLVVMDSTAFSLCMDNELPIIVFDAFSTGNLRAVVCGKKVGTLVSAKSEKA